MDRREMEALNRQLFVRARLERSRRNADSGANEGLYMGYQRIESTGNEKGAFDVLTKFENRPL